MTPRLHHVSALLLALVAAMLPQSPAAQTRDAQAFSTTSAVYHSADAPVRFVDTRTGLGGGFALAQGESRNLAIGGIAPVPASATAVLLNVTAIGSSSGYLTLWPAGQPRPLASNLNWAPNTAVPNLVQVALGTAGAVSAFNLQGRTDVLVDVEGWFGGPNAGTSGQFRPLMPARVADTRSGLGVTAGSLGPHTTRAIQVSGRGNVPSSGVSAVVLNVTATDATWGSFLTVFPGDRPLPTASNLNFSAGQTVPNRVVVRVPASGVINIYNLQGSVNVVVDVNGYYTDGSPASIDGGLFTGVQPARVLDTRDGTGAAAGVIGGGRSVSFNVLNANGVPATGVGAVVLNVTSTDATGGSYFTVYPGGNSRVLASDLNFSPGQVIANLVVVKPGGDGKVVIFNFGGTTDAVADIVGYYSSAPTTGALPSAPATVTATAHDRGAALSWSPPADTGGSTITSYAILSNPAAVDVVVSGDQTSYDLGGLTNTVSYSFSVTATNARGSGGAGTSAVVTPIGTPDPPVAVSATAGIDSATITWQPPANDGGSPVTGYVVVVYPGATAWITGTSWTIGGLDSRVTYTFSIQAWNIYGGGPLSAPSNPVRPLSSHVHKIVISIGAQHLWAYDGNTLLMDTPVTTGRPALPTPPGDYHIFYKASPYLMRSPWPYGSPYWYPDTWINWAMEFIQGGYFLHDAPWRTWFGPGSNVNNGTHGCVNIPNGPMSWLYGWANIGDEVVVQY